MQVESPPFITCTWILGEGHMTLEKSFHFLYEGFFFSGDGEVLVHYFLMSVLRYPLEEGGGQGPDP